MENIYTGDLILLRGVPGSGKSTFANVILQQPNNYTEGQISFPDKKIDLLYVGATPDLLLSIGKNALALFEQQVTEKQIPKEQATTALYGKFLHGSVSVPELNAFERFKSQYKGNEQAQRIFSNVEQSSRGTQSSAYKESFTEVILKLTEKFTAAQYKAATFPKGSYTIKDIQTYAKANPAAQQLYKSLKALADYIKTEAEQLDWLGKISKGLSKAASAAEGALFGVKIPGM